MKSMELFWVEIHREKFNFFSVVVEHENETDYYTRVYGTGRVQISKSDIGKKYFMTKEAALHARRDELTKENETHGKIIKRNNRHLAEIEEMLK
jgi:hypothetical protein